MNLYAPTFLNFTNISKMPLVSVSSIDEVQAAVRNAPSTTLLLFSADWCVACRPIKAEFTRRANDPVDPRTYIQVNVDADPEIAAAYRVNKLPTMLQLGRNGEVDPVTF